MPIARNRLRARSRARGTLDLLIPARAGVVPQLVEVVENTGGRLTGLQDHSWGPGLRQVLMKIAFDAALLPSMLRALGMVPGVAIRGFAPDG